jgi:uncharacterized membrane protein
MQRVELKKIHVHPDRFASWAPRIRFAVYGLFLIQFLLTCGSIAFGVQTLGHGRWPDGLLLVLAGASTLCWVGRQLPGQNVILAASIIAFIGGLVQTIGVLTATPFGPFIYTDNFGPQLFYPLPWAAPVLWVVIVLNSRGVARLILRPWRKIRPYGFWVIGVTVLLVVLFDFGLEPYATHAKRFWLWSPTKFRLDWYSTPWINFFGKAVITLFILAFATPSLINKRSVKHPPDYEPLAIWLLMNFMFATGATVHQMWPVLVFLVALSVLVTIFAIRGARW